MQIDTGYIQRIKRLRSDGYSYQKIADQVGVSIKTAHKWGKDTEVKVKSKEVKPSVTPSFTPIKTLPFTPGKVRVKVKGRGKSLPISAGIFLVLLIIGICAVVVWVYLTPEEQTVTKRTDESLKSPDGLDGRNIDEL